MQPLIYNVNITHVSGSKITSNVCVTSDLITLCLNKETTINVRDTLTNSCFIEKDQRPTNCVVIFISSSAISGSRDSS